MQKLSYSPPLTAENQPVDLFFPECKTNFPPEVINLIFLKLTAYDLSPLKAVSKEWKKILFDNPAIIKKLKFALECLDIGVDSPVSVRDNCDDYYNYQFNRSRLLGFHSVILKSQVTSCPCPRCQKYLQSFVEHWAEKDYKLTRNTILALPKGKFRNKVIPHLIKFALETTPEETIELIESISSKPIRARMLRSITIGFLNIPKAPLQEVESLVQKFPSEIDRSIYLAEIVKKKLLINPQEAKRIAQQILDPEIKFRINLEIIKFDALNDLTGTKSLIQALEKSKFKDHALGVVVEVECLIDLHSAKETVKLIRSDKVRDRALLAIIVAEASINISEAKKTVEWISHAKYAPGLNPYRNLALLNIAKIEALQDQDGAKKTVELIKGTEIIRLAYLLMADPNDQFALDQYNQHLQSVALTEP